MGYANVSSDGSFPTITLVSNVKSIISSPDDNLKQISSYRL